jgi:simple sugar transport system ATP-binding protein
MSIVFISSELEEELRISDRIVVLRDHKKAAEYSGDISDQTIMHTMAGNL